MFQALIGTSISSLRSISKESLTAINDGASCYFIAYKLLD